ncbi:MAG TPA: tRNA (adenosine(37)-N6)-dimethylallyltransferase MiaA [Bacteroidales bacterium]|jgi:tRNA dimethylallyltransferase|nr:tRNA (adenosine(37)-N6)-dimethylallyltransferase MiaA [Bacteroidales bacterium]
MREKSKPLLIIVAGPTAVGKTRVAVDLAKELGTPVINADSRQIYREMRIGTAMPSADEFSEVTHCFFGHRSISEEYDASRYENEVIYFLNDWFARNHQIVMAGGSGLYIDAVFRGIDDLPSIDPEIRRKLKSDYETSGIRVIREKLKSVDPEYYNMVDVHNPRRILKALEVYEMTGRSYSSYLTRTAKERNFRSLMIGLDMPRHELHTRINERVDKMIADGLLDEVRSLLPYRHLNALNTVGYKEMIDFIDGNCSFEEAVENIKAHTRQYARRQVTWFRRYPNIRWFHPAETVKIMEYIKEVH